MTRTETQPDVGAREQLGLLARVARRETEALSRLFDLWADALYTVAWHILRDQNVASAVVESVFRQIWNSPVAPDGSSPIHWAINLTRTLALQRLRKDIRDRNWAQAIQEIWRDDGFTAAQHGLELLPLEERQVLAMALLGGMNHQEIARVLGQSSPTIKQRIFNGLKHLRSFDRTAS